MTPVEDKKPSEFLLLLRAVRHFYCSTATREPWDGPHWKYRRLWRFHSQQREAFVSADHKQSIQFREILVGSLSNAWSRGQTTVFCSESFNERFLHGPHDLLMEQWNYKNSSSNYYYVFFIIVPFASLIIRIFQLVFWAGTIFFLSQQISRNSVSVCFFSEANGTYMRRNYIHNCIPKSCSTIR